MATKASRRSSTTSAAATPGTALLREALGNGKRVLDEPQAKKLLSEYGIPVVEGDVAGSVSEAVQIASAVGYPVVMKGVSEKYLHKSDAGLVLLDIPDEAALRSCYEELSKRGDGHLDGILVERMLPGGREFVVGMTRDPQFGPVVMFGIGGVLTEALEDVVFGVAPLDEREAGQLLDEIRASELLRAFRGSPAVARDQLIHIIRTVGRIGCEHPEVDEIDINPLLVQGSEPIAVDALITLTDKPAARPKPHEVPLSRLDQVFSPDSVAIVGASNDPAKWGGVISINVLAGYFPGDVYPVNPHAKEVFGRQAYPSVSSLPATPDLAVIAVPAKQVRDIVEECGRKGVKAVVVISGGFSEVGPEGAALEAEVAKTAAKYGMAMVGPNCIGVTSSWKRLYATGGVITRPMAGPASFISQSGNMGVQLMGLAEERQGGIGKFVGVGNEAVFNAADFMEYFRTDPQTGLVLGHIEGFRDGRQFMDTARRTASEKPVIVLRAGTSSFGQRAAASHTGAMAGSEKVFDAVARQTGIIATTDPDEFVDLAFALSYMPLPIGKRVAVVTMGGGWGVLSADEVARSGLSLVDLPADVIEEINGVLPPYWSHGNPVDLVGSIKEGAPERTVEAVVKSDSIDGVIVLGVIGMLTSPLRALDEAQRLRARSLASIEGGVAPDPEQYRSREGDFIKWVGELMRAYKKPIINVSVVPIDRSVFEGRGPYAPVVLPSPLRAVRVMAKMAKYREFLDACGCAARFAEPSG